MDDAPFTTLFMLSSLDGKVSTGLVNDRDFDKDLPRIDSLATGLAQYYELEQETDLFSLNTGKVMAKVGWNEPKAEIDKLPVSFVIVDNLPHLTHLGVDNLLRRTKHLRVVTTNSAHPAFDVKSHALEVTLCEGSVNWPAIFAGLRQDGVERLTVQSGGTLNADLLRAGLIDEISIVIAPLLVGGKETPSLVDGLTIETSDELRLVRSLKLISVTTLDHSYLHLRYTVKN